jgi:hypothetical protein
MKQNCWEANRCGREPGGRNVAELGVCPAAIETRVHQINEGMNGGRCCWAIAGTLCKGQKQGTYAMKIVNCVNCDFYKQVEQEGGRNVAKAAAILKLIV